MVIIKIQRALNNHSVLIYTKDRGINYSTALTKDIEDILKGRLKGYFEAKINLDNALEIGKAVKDLDW